MELNVITRREGVRTVVSVAGEIDVYTAPSLREQLTELDAQGCSDIVVDMSAVEFLDSTGLGVLVGGLKRARLRGGTLRLVSDQEKILKILRITGLIRVFPIHPTLDEALDVSDVRDVSAGTDGTAVTDVRDVAGLTRDVVPPLPGSAG